jgi:hypothetical protein
MFLFSSFAFSQDVNFGLKTGVNFANLTNSNDLNYKFGLNFGAVASLAISDMFSLQGELIYSAQGYKQDFNGQKVKGKIDYFIIPIIGDFEIAEDFSLQIGPQLGVNIRKDREIDGTVQGSIFVNDIDFSAVFGIQYFLDSNVFFQMRYAPGLTEVLSNIDQKNTVISASLGVFLTRTEKETDQEF